MANILITGGRAPVSLDLARSLAKKNHVIFMAESQPVQLSRFSNAITKTFLVNAPRHNRNQFINELVAIVLKEKIDILIPTCEEVFYISQGRDQFPSTCHVWVDDFKKMILLHNKWEFNQAGNQLGLTTPESFAITNEEVLKSYKSLSGIWILKPQYSRFGHKVFQGEMAEILKQPYSFKMGQVWVLQKFVSGPEYCAYALAYNGRIKALSIYSHEFLAGKAGICFEEIDCSIIEDSIRQCLANLNFTGQIAFDFILEDGKAYALECNPRATSGIHLLTSTSEFADVFLPNQAVQKTVRANFGSRSMILLAMIFFGFIQIQNLRKLKQWFIIVFSSREVIFSWRDPIPFFDQFICTLQLSWQAWRKKINILSASTEDIEWNGEV